jgi:hypothetical protein
LTSTLSLLFLRCCVCLLLLVRVVTVSAFLWPRLTFTWHIALLFSTLFFVKWELRGCVRRYRDMRLLLIHIKSGASTFHFSSAYRWVSCLCVYFWALGSENLNAVLFWSSRWECAEDLTQQ